MASKDEVEHLVRGLNMEVTEHNENFHLTYGNRTFELLHSDVDQYINKRPELKRATETQVFFSGYYEHVVQYEGGAARRPSESRGSTSSLQSRDGRVRVSLGRLSPLFIIALGDTDRLSSYLQRFLRPSMGMGLTRYSETEVASISDLFRLVSIKVVAEDGVTLGRNTQRLHEIAEAALFHFAFHRRIAISFTKSWERTYYWLGRRGTEEIQFPQRTYNSELIGYYNLALSNDSLVLGYLALYKISEFFYTSVAEQALHEKLRTLMASPDFTPNKPPKLRELVKSVRQFESKIDELSALRLVLSSFFEKAELREWIETYESRNGQYFTEQRAVFGTTFRTDTSDNTVIPNVATRIYSIRNALVHSKEGEVGRFIPYSGQEEILNKEIQLILFIGEQLIVRSGKDLDIR